MHALGVAVDVAWQRTRMQQWENCVFYGSDPRKCFLHGLVPGYITRGSLQSQVTKTNDRPDLSSEGAPDIDKTVTVTQ
jgi:hypothetical protein